MELLLVLHFEVQSELLGIQQNFPTGSFLHLLRLTLEEPEGWGHHDKTKHQMGHTEKVLLKQIVKKYGGSRYICHVCDILQLYTQAWDKYVNMWVVLFMAVLVCETPILTQ